MLTIEEFTEDFDYLKSRKLYLKIDNRFYEVYLTYVPFLEITDYVNYIENIDSTLRFILFSTKEFDLMKNILVTVFKAEGEKFKIKTLYIKLSRAFPIVDQTRFEDIFTNSNMMEKVKQGRYFKSFEFFTK